MLEDVDLICNQYTQLVPRPKVAGIDCWSSMAFFHIFPNICAVAFKQLPHTAKDAFTEGIAVKNQTNQFG